MFVHGGISEEDEYLNDCHLLSFNPLKWFQCSISTGIDSPTLAWHSACLVLPSEQSFNPKMNIYKLPEIGIGRRQTMKVKNYFLIERLKKKEFIFLEVNQKKEFYITIYGF